MQDIKKCSNCNCCLEINEPRIKIVSEKNIYIGIKRVYESIGEEVLFCCKECLIKYFEAKL